MIRRDSRTTSDKILVSVAFGLFTGCILLSIYLFCTRIMTTAGLLLGLVTVLGSLYAVFFVSDRKVQASIAAAEGDLANLRRYLAESRPALEQARAALADARQKYGALRREFRRLEKRAAQAPVQRSTPFDDFLKNAFNSLGYQAVVISRSGESRIHLVVEKAGVRTAIQLRPQEESIGKNAVQQAHSGMKAHACDRCAIITNGSFTPTAVEFARQVNCTLVDGPRIADLVAGKIEPFRAEHGP